MLQHDNREVQPKVQGSQGNIKLRPGGSVVSNAGGNGGARDRTIEAIKGWTAHQARANRSYLQRIDFAAMLEACVLLSASLTVRDLPQDAKAFHKARAEFLIDCKRLTLGEQKAGLVAHHWVLEWQPDHQAPHLHLALAFPPGEDVTVTLEGLAPVIWTYVGQLVSKVTSLWLHHSRQWGTLPVAQYVVEMDRPDGWRVYLAKHAARSVKEAQEAMQGVESLDQGGIAPKIDQRDSQYMPETWRGRSGRVWGHSRRGWVLQEESLGATPWERHQVKRLQRRWERSRARAWGTLARSGRITPESQLFAVQLAAAPEEFTPPQRRAWAHRSAQWLQGRTSDLPGPWVARYLKHLRSGTARRIDD